MTDQPVISPPASVLIVDDNPLIVNVIQGLLQAEQYEVFVSSNGKEALSVLGGSSVDVIICDVMMPTMDGYEFFEIVRKNPDLSHIPFVFLTALGDHRDVQKGMESGADDYLVKPFDPRSLVSVIKGKVRRSRTAKALSDERYNTYRKKVVHTLSHEFRTPLVAINTGSELLLDQSGSLDGRKSQQLLEAIRRGGQRLERLVNDFMVLQQLDAGIAQKVFDTRSQVVCLNKVMENFVGLHGDEIREQGFSLAVADDGKKAWARVYEPHLTDVLMRLINNSIKFKKTDLTIELALISDDTSVTIEVRDRGLGVDVVKVREVVQAFSQLDRDKLEQQGSGVGLAISDRYVRLAGGTLGFEPRDEGGTIVKIVFPKCAAPSAV